MIFQNSLWPNCSSHNIMLQKHAIPIINKEEKGQSRECIVGVENVCVFPVTSKIMLNMHAKNFLIWTT